MLKRITSVLAGLATAFIIFMIFQLISSRIYPVPSGMRMNDPVVMKSYVSGLPVGAFLLIMAGYITGSFAAGAVIKVVSRSANKKPAIITGILLTLGGLINFITIPHPLWMAVVSTILYIPMVLAGFTAVKTRNNVI